MDHLLPVLRRAEQLYVGVRTRGMPHVTPELFTVSNGVLLCMTAATTLKVKRARRDPLVAFGARAGAGVVVGLARAEVVDPAHPVATLRAPATAAASAVGVARFVRDNASEMAGAALDAVSGRLGLLPPHRVVLALRPVAALVLYGDDVTWQNGSWQAGVGPVDPGHRDDIVDRDEADDTDDTGAVELDLAAVPDHLAALVEPGGVVLGWTTAGGAPLALPARWDGDGSVSVPAALLEHTGAATESAACVTFDTWTGYGPTGKRGLMLRGSGRVRPAGGRRATVELAVDRASHWDGVETGTVELDPLPPAAS